MTSKKLYNKKGFTMVELLVTLAIMVVLAGVASMSLLAYNDYATFKRQNEYAQSLFVAAQNALTRYSENGELEGIERQIEKYGLPLEKEMLRDGAADQFNYEDRLYTIVLNKDGTALNSSGSEEPNPILQSIFEQIFGPYVYDKSILSDASVAIEFDPRSGVVYSVLYSDVKQGFVYGEDEGRDDGHVSISYREEEARRGRKVGYYGIVELSDETSRTKEKPVIDWVRLVNGDSLSLEFRLTDKYAEKATGALDYELTVYHSETQKPMLSLTIRRIPSVTGEAGVLLDYDSLKLKAEVTAYNMAGEKAGDPVEYQFAAYVDENKVIHLLLDSVDLSAETGKTPAALKDTYSFRRFGLEKNWDDNITRDIFVKVRAKGSKYKTSAWKSSNTENAYFASEKHGTANDTVLSAEYGVANARHLYNIRFEEERNITGKQYGFTYNLTDSFAWSGEGGIFRGLLGSEIFRSGAVVPESAGEGENLVYTAFPSIEKLKLGHSFTSPSQTKTISGLVLQGGTGLGLFGTNEGSITKVTLENAQVSGKNSVGSFCGVNKGKVEELTTIGGSVSGNQDVGGIVGKDETTAQKDNEEIPQRIYQNLHNGSDVSGHRYVGGIVGRLAAPDEGRASLLDCTNTGLILAKIGADTDLTQAINDRITDAVQEAVDAGKKISITSYDVNTNEYNMYSMFQTVNRDFTDLSPDGYPLFNSYDEAVLTQLLADTGLSINGYSSVEEYCTAHKWVPCAVKDPNGIFISNDAAGNVHNYSVILVSRKISSSATSAQRSEFAYYNGKYYYHTNTRNTGVKIEEDSLTNRETSIDWYTDPTKNWFEYTPEISTGQLNPVEGTTTFKNEPSYLGGIVGFADGKGVSGTGKGFTIENCVSTPSADAEQIRTLLEEDAAYEQETEHAGDHLPLLGVYAGGIAGYADKAVITGCSTEGGYVVGSHYVGGILGFGEETELKGGSSNAANAVGRYFVGGVVGANCLPQRDTTKNVLDANGFVRVSTNASTDTVLDNWTNRGVVVATKTYGGGLTGYNAGVVKDCGSDVEPSGFMQEVSQTYGGSQLGGLVGYNCGSLTSESLSGITAYVAGKDYIGGLIGYNDALENTAFYGYSFAGGSVIGRDFVGGIAGVNLSPNLYRHEEAAGEKPGWEMHTLYSNPNLVQGRYCVGGAVGGNLLYQAVANANDPVDASFDADNFLGKVEADAFAGGFIGLNMMVKAPDDARSVTKLITDCSSAAADASAEERQKALEEAVGELASVGSKEAGSSGIESSGTVMKITGQKDGNRSHLGGITAKVYVGGILGYNVQDTSLEISSLINGTPVTATGFLIAEELTGTDNLDLYADNAKKTYSYAGGIVGKCSESMKITNCSADDTGRVISSGTYTGGLVEVNEGSINLCKAANLGQQTQNYVGGIVGLNKPQGSIVKPELNGKTVTGKNMVGGIAADNYGTVTGVSEDSEGKIELRGTVYGYGENVGGIAGYSHNPTPDEGTELKPEDKKASVSEFVLAVNLYGTGVNAGGGIGNNEGEMSDISYVESAGNSYQIQGDTNVGGIVGRYSYTISSGGTGEQEAKLTGLYNIARVTANYGYAGGIAGVIEGKARVENCSSTGTVSVLGKKSAHITAAGGITGHLREGSISHCTDTGSVEALKGAAGGIVGINNGTVADCTVKDSGTPGSLNAVTLTVNGGTHAGGIAGQNTGKINGCKVDGLKLTTPGDRNGGYLGGIAGENAKAAPDKGAAESEAEAPEITRFSVRLLKVTTGSSSVAAGGVAGLNGEGAKVTGAAGTVNVDTVELGFTAQDLNHFGYLGGAVGKNLGEAVNCSLKTVTVLGTANDPANPPKFSLSYDYETEGAEIYGYGGLVGVNGTADSRNPVGAVVSNCVLNGVKVSVIGASGNIACAGGAAGVNGKTAKIKNVTLADASTDKNAACSVTASDIAHTGGMVGYNYGLLERIGKSREAKFGDGSTTESEAARRASGDDATVMTVETSKGHTGGIVGYNKSTGQLIDCATGKKWSVKANNHSQDSGAGGIIGYNSSSAEILRCDNWAAVTKNVIGDSAAGIAGRNEVANGNWYMEDCNNFGAIDGRRTGGIIGCLKYNGGTLYNCSNYGAVKGSSDPSGGILGMVYSNTANEVLTITSCKNYGSLADGSSSHVGGIVGLIHSRCVNFTAEISDCVNTGVVKVGGTASAGIVAGGESKTPAKGYEKTLVIKNCKNYGIPTGHSMTDQFSGILYEADKVSTNNVLLVDCFGAAGLTYRNGELNSLIQYPIAPDGLIEKDTTNEWNNYWFTNAERTKSSIPGITVESGIYNKQDLINIVDGDKNSSCVFQASSGSGNEVKITLNFEKPITFSTAEFYLTGDLSTSEKNTLFYVVNPGDTPVEFGEFVEIEGSDGEFYRAKGAEVTASQVIFSIKAKNPNMPLTLFELGFDGQVGENAFISGVSGDEDISFRYGVGEALYLEESGSGNTYDAFRFNGADPVIQDLTFGGQDFYGFTHKDYGLTLIHDLYVLGKDSNNPRQKTYLEIDGKLYVGEDDVPQTPEKLALSDLGGKLELTWDCDNPAGYKYEIVVTKSDEDGKRLDAEARSYFVFDKRFQYSTVGLEGRTLWFKVKAYSRSGKPSAPEFSEELKYEVPAQTLPVPEVHFLLTGLGDKDQYRMEVVNAAAYQYCGKVTITASIRPTDGGGTKTYELKLEDGKMLDPTYVACGSGKDNYMITVQAVQDPIPEDPEKQYGNSPNSTRESMMPKIENYVNSAKNAYMAAIRNTNLAGGEETLGFRGASPEELAYRLEMVQSGKYATYYRSEFLATDNSSDGLGVPVAYAFSDLSVPGTVDTYAPAVLNNLPADLMTQLENGEQKYQNAMVRSYPISMANQIVYTGFDLGKEFTVENLKALKVSNDGKIDENGSPLISVAEDGTKTLAPGYIIFKTGEDSYTLSFNVLVKDAGTQEKNQVRIFQEDLSQKKAYAPPDITELTYDPQTETLSASWTSKLQGTQTTLETGTASYRYTLTGETKDGALVEIESGTLTAPILSNGGAPCSKTWNSTETASWNYTHVTLRVDRLGTVNGSGVTQTFGSTASKTTETRLRLSTITAPSAQLLDKDGIQYRVSWNGLNDAEELEALSHYELTVKATIEAEDGTEHAVTALYRTNVADGLNEAGPKEPVRVIDLNSITGTDSGGSAYTGSVVPLSTVTLSVRAIALDDEDHKTYGSGLPGVEYSFVLPQRLTVPNLSKLTLTPDGSEILSVFDFDTVGFTFNFDGTESPDKDAYGKYQMAVTAVTHDNVETVLFTTDSPLVMKGSYLNSASCTLSKSQDLTAQFAGGSLKVKLRAVSDRNVSSLWSEEKEFKLPQVQVDAVDMAAAIGTKETDVTAFEDKEESTVKVKVKRDVFTWEQAEYTGGYSFELNRITGDEAAKTDKAELTLDENNVPSLTFTDADGVLQPDGSTKAEPKEIIPIKAISGNTDTYTFTMNTRRAGLLDSSSHSTRFALKLDEMLDVTADSYDYASEQAMNRLVTLLEPCMLILMGFMVGFIMLAILLPIFGSYNAIEQSATYY